MALNDMPQLLVANNTIIVDYKNIENVCRSCLSKEVALDLFHAIYEGKLLSEIYTLTLLQEVKKDDKLPSKLCKSCGIYLVQYYNFKRMALHSEVVLQKVIGLNNLEEESLLDTNNGEDEPVVVVIVHDSEESNTNIEQEENVANQQFEHETQQSERDQEIVSQEANFTCSLCGSMLKTFAEYKFHRRRELLKRMKRYPCPVCQKIVYYNKFTEHMCRYTKEHPLQCEICGKQFMNRYNFRKHSYVHRKEKPHACHLCTKSFLQAKTLRIHLRSHTSENPYKCKFCRKMFSNKFALKMHIMKHNNLNNDPKPYINTCLICDKSFGTQRGLKIHILTHF